ncbi:ATPase AAA [Candidatus Magnetomorum sp. HK-1]|nr:ATPase AAA [Candidatus Magnetomorum sp. HK-1]
MGSQKKMNYESFFNFKEKPFTQSPDTDFYFSSEAHKEAMQHLLYCIRSDDGFIEISGHPGTGKTMIIRSLLKQIAGENINVSFIVNSKAGPQDLINAIALDFGLDSEIIDNNHGEQLLRLLHQHLVQLNAENTIPIIIIDEAQNLSSETLEQLCLISNLETEKKKLVKIILVGQLELEKRLNQPEFQKIYNRITIRYRIKPLSKKEMNAYIQYRIRIASASDNQIALSPFTPLVLNQIFRYSKGIPRIVNTICDRAFMAAFIDNTREITPIHIKKAVKSLIGERPESKGFRTAFPIRIGILSLILLALVYIFFQWPSSTETTKIIPLKVPIEKKETTPPSTDKKTISSPAEEKQAITPTVIEKQSLTTSQAIEEKTIKSPDSTVMVEKKLPSTMQTSGSEKLTPTNLITPDSMVVIFTPKDNRMIVWKGQMNLSLLNQTDPSLLKIDAGTYFLGKESSMEQVDISGQSKSLTTNQEDEDYPLSDESTSLSLSHINDEFDPSFLQTDMDEPLTKVYPSVAEELEKLGHTSFDLQADKMNQETVKETTDAVPQVKKKQVLAPKKSPAPTKPKAKQSESKSDPINHFPQEMITVPKGKVVVMISPDVNRLFVWKGTSNYPKFVHQAALDSSLKEGVYILGKEKGSPPFMFHPEPSQSVSRNVIETLWQKVGKQSSTSIIPVIVSLSEKSISRRYIERGKKIPSFVRQWVEAWRVKDFYQYMNCYDKKTILFYKTDKPPITLAWDVLKNSQAKIFSGKTNRVISVSEPVCLLDPGNPTTSVAIFNQEHSDDNYSESGVKVLYLMRAKDSDNIVRWKINGRIWIQGVKMMETIP